VNVSDSTTIGELLSQTCVALKIAPENQRLLIGFPPKELDTSDWTKSLADAGIKKGDSVMVEQDSAKRGIVKASIEESSNVIYSIPKNQGLFARRAMPMDNSCLFHSIAYVCLDRKRDAADSMRRMIAEAVASDPRTYNETLLEQSNAAYQRWILNPKVWGGAIELDIFSTLFRTEIIAFDPDYLREDVFGQNMGYYKRVFIIYTSGDQQGQQSQGGHSAHYDALVFCPNGTSTESNDKVVFSTKDNYAWERARQFIELLHKDRVTKNASLSLCKQWRRTTSGDETKASVGRSMVSNASSTPQALSSSWNCANCTFLNKPTLKSCEICGSAK
jgi:hypothetical protein